MQVKLSDIEKIILLIYFEGGKWSYELRGRESRFGFLGHQGDRRSRELASGRANGRYANTIILNSETLPNPDTGTACAFYTISKAGIEAAENLLIDHGSGDKIIPAAGSPSVESGLKLLEAINQEVRAIDAAVPGGYKKPPSRLYLAARAKAWLFAHVRACAGHGVDFQITEIMACGHRLTIMPMASSGTSFYVE